MVDLENTGINDQAPAQSAIGLKPGQTSAIPPAKGIEPGSATPIPQYPGGPDTSVIPQNPQTPNIIPQQSGETGAAAVPSRAEQRAIGYELESVKSPFGLPGADETGALSRQYIENKIADYGSASDARKLTPDEANKLYPGMPVPFSEPVDPFVAHMQYQNVQRWQKMQEWKDRGGATPGWDFLMGLGGGVLDPLNATLAAITGGLGEVAPALRTLPGVWATNFGMNLTSGAIAGKRMEAEHVAPFSIPETIGGAALGATAGTAIHFGLGALFKAFSEVKKLTPELQEKAVKTAITQDEIGAKPDLSSIDGDYNSRIRGETNDGPSGYRLTPITSVSDRPYYLGRDSQGSVVTLDSLGHGLQGTDHGEAMNNLSKQMAKVTLNDNVKLLNLDQKMSPVELKELLGPESQKLIKLDEVQGGMSLREVMDQLQQKGLEVPQEPGKALEIAGRPVNPENPMPDLLQMFQERMQEKGYQGYQYQGRDSQGIAIDNRIHIFPDSMREMLSGQTTVEGEAAKQITHQDIESNPEVSPQISESKQAEINESMKDPANSKYADPELDKDIHDLRHGPMLNNEPDAMDDTVKQIHQEATAALSKMATEEGPHAEFAKQALEELKKSEVLNKQMLDMMKRIADCAGGSS